MQTYHARDKTKSQRNSHLEHYHMTNIGKKQGKEVYCMDISKSYSYNPFDIVVSVSLMVFSSLEDNQIMNLTKLTQSGNMSIRRL